MRDAHVAGAAPPAQGIGRAEHPRPMADRRHRHLLCRRLAHQLHHPAVAPHVIRRRPAWNHDQRIVRRLHVAGRLLALLRIAVLADVCLTGLGADDVDGVPRLLQPQAWILKLEVFVDLFDEDCDFGH